MVDLGDALGVLLIGSLFVVVFWRVFEAWLDAKMRKRVDEAKRDHENDVPHDADRHDQDPPTYVNNPPRRLSDFPLISR